MCNECKIKDFYRLCNCYLQQELKDKEHGYIMSAVHMKSSDQAQDQHNRITEDLI